MAIKYSNTTLSIIKYNDTELDKVVYNKTTVYQRIVVNYYCENSVYKSVKVVSGTAISLSSSNAASKSGYTFVGWRLDKTASSSVQSSITADTSTINLYAVYRKSITVTYYNNSTSASSTSGYQYYNNGNITNPSFKLTQASRSGWTARGWSTSTAANGAISYNNGASFTRDSNVTLYGMYQKTVTLSYNGNGATGGSTASQSGTAYYNSRNVTTNPSFGLRSNGFSRTNYRFVNWRMGSASGTAYNAGATVTLSSNTVFYAYWQLVYTASTLTLWGGGNYAYNDGLVPLFSKPAHNASDVSSDSSLTGNTISLVSGDIAYVKANVACTVNISGTLYFKGVDGYTWYLWKIYIFRNSSSYSKILDGGNYSGSGQPEKSWSLTTSNIVLNAGDTVRIMVQGGVDGESGRTSFYTKSPHITITATPR